MTILFQLCCALSQVNGEVRYPKPVLVNFLPNLSGRLTSLTGAGGHRGGTPESLSK